MSAPHRWVSLHLHMDARDVNRFLATGFAIACRGVAETGLVRRQFHLRYALNGAHIRWRLQVARGASPNQVRRLARRWIRSKRGGVRVELRDGRYDRRAHYFGDTMASVYAELLNVETSSLAMSLPSARWSRRRRVVIAAAMLARVARACSRTLASAVTLLEEAHHLVASHRGGAAGPVSVPEGDTVALVHGIEARVPAPSRRLVQLLHRCRAREDLESVAAHAVHLLANKLGLRPSDELAGFALARGSLLAFTSMSP
jgi:hypothetical protein